MNNLSKDKLIIGITNTLSDWEIRDSKDRVRLTRLSRFDNGIVTGRCPLGYRPRYRNTGSRRGVIKIVPDPKKVEIIQDIFFMTSQGKKYKEICDKHKLKPQSYYNTIKNKVYIGIITFEGKEKKGIHSPLITSEIFYKVNPTLKEHETS